jgi:SAM-dependent methyltransferase
MGCIFVQLREVTMAHVVAAQMIMHYGHAGHALPAWLTSHSFVGLSLAPAALVGKLRYAMFRLSELLYEWRYGIVSDTEILADQLGITDLACHDYLATGYMRFRQVMRHLVIRPDEDVFLDFGSGLGRAVILAGTYPFRKVIGVELVAELHTRAQENVRRAMRRLRCRDIELHNVDARSFHIPADVTIVYMWNPFSGEVLRQVLANIRQSFLEAPRVITIVHLSPTNPTDLDAIKETLPWLRECKRLRLGKTSHAVIYSCGEPDVMADAPQAVPELAEAGEA